MGSRSIFHSTPALFALLHCSNLFAQDFTIPENGNVSSAALGPTTLVVDGMVSRFDPTMALLTVGDVDIYVPDSLSTEAVYLEGTRVSVVGASTGGLDDLVAIAISVEAPAMTTRRSGPESQSISGTGVQSISGTGIRAQSIEATGIVPQSISGTGALSISGTGRSAMGVPSSSASTQSISGTGKQSISGTGAQ